MSKKLFVIKKFVMAEDIDEALRLEKRVKPEEAWVEDSFRERILEEKFPSKKKDIGFSKK